MTRTRKTKTARKPTEQIVSNKTKLLELLRRAGGASLTDITGATGWLPHSARAMLTVLRKKGLVVGKQKTDGITRYSISDEPVA